jgi:hypothetical protein
MAFVKAGHRYYYNNTSGAVYPWSPDLEKVKGLTLFLAPRDGEFDIGMMLAGEPVKEAPAAKPKASRVKPVKYRAEEPQIPPANSVEVPTASGSATIPAVNLTSSDFDDE